MNRNTVVIIGGGIVGCSTAYHLQKSGLAQVILLEKNELTAGATWHAAGLVGQLRSTHNTTRMLQQSVRLYDYLQEELGYEIDWRKVGSLRLASSVERGKELDRLYTQAISFNMSVEMISAIEAQQLFPVMSTEGVEKALFIPEDGYIDPSSVTHALAKEAKKHGALIYEHHEVTGLEIENQTVRAVLSGDKKFEADTVLNATGMWARDLGGQSNLRIPACAVEHQFLVTDVIEGLPKNMPTMRDPDLLVYYKPEAGSLVVGGYESNTIPFGLPRIDPRFGKELLAENYERFEGLAENAIKRTPVVGDVGVKRLINGPIPYSADGDFIMGRMPDLKNGYVASGFLYGIAAGGGAGQMMAEWILDGRPSIDLWPFDVRRFNPHHSSSHFLKRRSVELYGEHYKLHYPQKEAQSARNIRRSGLHYHLKQNGAVFGSKGGFERANYFALDEKDQSPKPSYDQPSWFEVVGKEHKAVREKVAVIDQSSFSKMEIKGSQALELLQYLCVSQMDKPIGSITYTQMCNEHGGIEADLTVARLETDKFYLVTGSVFGSHDLSWIETHLDRFPQANVTDMTSGRAVINLCGPLARKVLQKTTDDNVSNEALPFSSFKNIFVGAAPVLCARIGYVGELGYELHIPAEYGAHVYEVLAEAGKEYELAQVGYKAIDSLRMEKGYLYWSADITPDYNPYEAGLGFKIALKSKQDFCGRNALEKVKETGVKQKLFCFTIEEENPMLYGGEAVFCGDQVVSVTSSGNYAYTFSKPICLAYLDREYWEKDDFEIMVLGKKYRGKKHRRCLYDPEMKKLKM